MGSWGGDCFDSCNFQGAVEAGFKAAVFKYCAVKSFSEFVPVYGVGSTFLALEDSQHQISTFSSSRPKDCKLYKDTATGRKTLKADATSPGLRWK